MSFDLKLFNGDLVIGKKGDVDIVENGDKLVQDVLKIVSTPLGSNPFFPWYGSPMSSALIGTGYEEEFISTVASQQLNAALDNLKQLQNQQKQYNQIITPAEQIAAVQDVSVNQDAHDPRFYIVRLTVISKAFQRVEPTFAVPIS
jgi:hypothetical protein